MYKVLIYHVFLTLKVILNLANSADSDECSISEKLLFCCLLIFFKIRKNLQGGHRVKLSPLNCCNLIIKTFPIS